MFCRKCGKTLLDGDRFCSYCGAQVIERSDCVNADETLEEVVYNKDSLGEKSVDIVKAKETNSDTKVNTNIDVAQIPMTPKREDKKERIIKKGKTSETKWNLDGFPGNKEQHKKTDDIKVDWTKRQVLTFDIENNNEESVGKENNQSKKEEVVLKNNSIKKPDIFELFDKQLEEEEKVVKEEKKEENRPKEVGNCLEQELFGTNRNIHNPAEEEIDKFYTFSKKNEEFQKLLDKEYERLKKVSDFNHIEMQNSCNCNIENISRDLPENVFQIDENKKQEESEESFKSEQKSESENSILKSGISSDIEIEQDQNEIEIQIEEEQKEIFEQNPEEVNGELFEENNQIEEESQEKTVALPWDEITKPLNEFTDEEEGKKISPMGIILIIIVILLAFEITILGIKCFLPQSNAAEFINNKLGVAVNWVDSLKNENITNEEDLEQQEKSNDDSVKEANAVPKADSKPNPDTKALIAECLAYNKNIKTIEADDDLYYIENKEYKDKNINNSKPIEDNIWYKDENGNAVYYDKEVVKAIIQFDSTWIDYVNDKDDSVFDFLKKGSTAYNLAKDFSKVGKVKEDFELLKIGEIRQGENGFYIWTHETIKTTEAGKTSEDQHDWVYYLEPVEKQMKIVSFSKF